MMEMLEFPRKDLRTKPIIEHVKAGGYKGIVCFSCGNATRALRKACNVEGIYMIGISPEDALVALEWWSMAEIHRAFDGFFDATSGHLPFEVMNKVAAEFIMHIGKLEEYRTYDVATGSGETITCLRLAYPGYSFRAVYNLNEATKYKENAPLNHLVKVMGLVEYNED